MVIAGTLKTDIEKELKEKKSKDMREERDKLLKDSDFMVLPDVKTDKERALVYRQALRDLTDLPDWPDVVFPVL